MEQPRLTAEQIEKLTDAEILEVYAATTQEVGDRDVELLIPEMTKRDLGF